ncbi:MAG: hypothetical protein F6K56_05600 [Moorea sp. SIO3G5]|nr:hypothetical protein [Moorena sp. SIO3G5]
MDILTVFADNCHNIPVNVVPRRSWLDNNLTQTNLVYRYHQTDDYTQDHDRWDCFCTPVAQDLRGYMVGQGILNHINIKPYLICGFL